VHGLPTGIEEERNNASAQPRASCGPTAVALGNVTTVEHRIEVGRELGWHVRHGAGFLPVCGHPFARLTVCLHQARALRQPHKTG
jgi:hypothetical protein